ncbi:MAG: hypothetical protein H6581_22015 [Bacteroidia bacterium]|nr:hypothetical protein [Bacteroidia bacterium]
MKFGLKKIAIYAGIILVSWVLVGVSSGYRRSKPCVEFRVLMNNQENNYFLDLDDVKNQMRQVYGKPLEGSMMGEIKVADLEYSLRLNPFIEHAEVYKDQTCKLVAEISLRRPIARVEPISGKGFYLDETFHKVPLTHKFSANTVLLTGAIFEPDYPSDSIKTSELQSVLPVLSFIDRDEFLRAQVSEVVINARGELIIFPEVGNTPIEFGKPENLEEKFTNLFLFYKKVLNKVGWKKYKRICLKYKGQVVAEKI